MPPCDFECFCWVCMLFIAVAVSVRPLSHGRQSRRRLVYQRQGIHGKHLRLPHGLHCMRILPSTELATPFLSCRSKKGRMTGDSRTTQLYVSFQRGDSLHGNSKQINVNFHKEFASWIVFSGKCNLNN